MGNWKFRNIMILCMKVLPSFTPLTIEAKLLSVRIMSPASLATSVPAFIANPTSAFFNAGESLVPSKCVHNKALKLSLFCCSINIIV